MFGFITNHRPVSIKVIEGSKQEQGLMDLMNKHQIANVKCKLGCLFGYITQQGEFVNEYIINIDDFNKIHKEIKEIGKLRAI